MFRFVHVVACAWSSEDNLGCLFLDCLPLHKPSGDSAVPASHPTVRTADMCHPAKLVSRPGDADLVLTLAQEALQALTRPQRCVCIARQSS